MLFSGPDNPQNCPFTWKDLDPHLIHGSLGPPESAPYGISISLADLAGLTNVTNIQTDTQTDHATPSLAICRINPLLRHGLKIYCPSAKPVQTSLLPLLTAVELTAQSAAHCSVQ